MNPNNSRNAWSRLTAAARQVPDERDVTIPYGFSTRVAALALSHVRSGSLIERFAFRAVGMACLLAVASVAINYSSLRKTVTAEDDLASDDVVAALLED